MKRRTFSILRLSRSFVFQPIAAILVVALIPLLSRFEGDAGIRISEASAQAAPTNPILPVGHTTIESDLRELESDAVNAYLALHGLPATDSSIIYTYGRSDLRSEIRGLMINILLGIILKPASQRTVHERNLYKWLLELVQQNEIAEYTQAVNQFNSWNTNKCFFKLDGDLASQYKIKYDGTPFCIAGNFFGLLVPPPVPVASYFTAYGLKFSYGKPALTDRDFALIVADTESMWPPCGE